MTLKKVLRSRGLLALQTRNQHTTLLYTEHKAPSPPDIHQSLQNNIKLIMSLLEKLSDFVIETSEQAVKVFEEGTSLFLQGDGIEDTSSITNDHDHAYTYSDTINTDSPPSPDDLLNFESPLNGIADGVLGDIFQKQTMPQSTWENVQAFRSAILWSEPFILSLLAFHVLVIFAMFYAVRRGGIRSQFAVLGSIFAIVRMAERLNLLGSQHWERIATQDYFDSSGVFVSLMVCAPLLVISMVMLVCFVKEAGGLLIEVKTHELKAKSRARKNAKNGKTTTRSSGKVKKEKKEN